MTAFQPEKVIVDIIQTKLSLPASYGTYQGNIIPSIVIGSQNALLGNTEELQVVVQSINDKVIHNRTYYKGTATTHQEINEQIIFSTMQVDIQSRNNDARDRRSEILYALNSTYAQEKQTTLGCRIFEVPINFINTGEIQGGSALNRWTIRFKMTYKQTNTNSVDYYDKFKVYAENEDDGEYIYFYEEN